MNTVLFRTVHNDSSEATTQTVSFDFEGRQLNAPKGVTVAAALMQNQVLHFRDSPVSGQPRAPYCQMGVCFECLLQIDGVQNRQSCMTTIQDGMVIRMQQGQTTFTVIQTGEEQ
jgi:predicted molibdopterin-dependent oxidoreductase YjgC